MSVLESIASWWTTNVQGTMTMAAVIQMLISIVGFPILIYQVLKLRANIEGATQDRLYGHYTEICKLFMQHPELRPYFYGRSDGAGKTVTANDSLAPKVAFMCEAILGLVEHAVLQRKNLPSDSWGHCWRPYALERLKESQALEDFFFPNEHWYAYRMGEEMRSMKSELDRKRAQPLGKRRTQPA